MKETFRGYYRPTDDEFLQLWENCLFVFDANVLLSIYRYTPKTRQNLIDILSKISDRLWLPHQSALEYQQRRLDVIDKQKSTYNEIQELLKNTQNKLENELNSYKIHPFIEIKNFLERLNDIFLEIKEELDYLKKEHPNLIDNDELIEVITNLFNGKVGSPCSPEELEKIYTIGKKRYDREIPPGYKDKSKDGLRKYGDLVLWFQIIEHAKSTKNSMIFITDERKEDWWQKFSGKIIGPHPELINEIFSKTGVNFYIYQTDQFMEYAGKCLHEPVDLDAIDEVQKIRKFDENYYDEKMRQERKEDEEYLKQNPEEAKLIQLDYAVVKAQDELDMLINMGSDDWEIEEKRKEIDYLWANFENQFKSVHGRKYGDFT